MRHRVFSLQKAALFITCALTVCVLVSIVLFAKLTLYDGGQSKISEGKDETVDPHVLAVVVPFRDRFEELLEFAPHMSKFLDGQGIVFKIYVINQVDLHRFNRASLINVGFLLSQGECDYLVMHDVDLLPLNTALDYRFPKNDVFHISAPYLHPKYHYRTFVGGILMITHKAFENLNGFSNRFWGWGREDDEFYLRMKDAGLEVQRPVNISTGYETFKHLHDPVKRPRDYKRIGSQKQGSKKRDHFTGVSTLRYRINASYILHIAGFPLSVYNVMLECDREDTPWCDDDDGVDS